MVRYLSRQRRMILSHPILNNPFSRIKAKLERSYNSTTNKYYGKYLESVKDGQKVKLEGVEPSRVYNLPVFPHNSGLLMATLNIESI